MPQTKQGADQNPWLVYMKLCAEHYKAGGIHPPPLPFKDAADDPGKTTDATPQGEDASKGRCGMDDR